LRFVDLRSRLPGGPVRGVADPVAVAAGAASIWAASASDRTVSRVDPSKNKVYTISVGETPTALVADADGVWVAVE
jgi:DNA-binding beta-propeller fold protein YncE